MKKVISIVTIIALLLTLATSVLAFKNNNSPPSAANTYFIGFQSNIDKNALIKHGGEIKRQYKYMPVVVAKLPEQAISALSKNPNIEYIEKDEKVQITNTQTIPWGIPHIKAAEVQNMGYTGQGVKVGILDTGIDYNHEDLKVSGGATFVEGTSDFMDDNGHGTHVAGIVAAQDNEFGVIGVAPEAELFGIKVLDRTGTGNYSDIISGLEWAIDNNIDILNMSFGGTVNSKTFEKILSKAYQSGMLLVASAGNLGYDEKGSITYPAAYSSVIAVGAVDQNNQRAEFSSVGKELELMAPGVEILGTLTNNNYGFKSGTSMASPYVVGAAAQVWQAKNKLTNFQLREELNVSITTLGVHFEYGSGLLDVSKAVQ